MKNVLLLFLILIIGTSCNNTIKDPVEVTQDNQQRSGQAIPSQTNNNFKEAIVLEAIPAGTYTYVRLKSNGDEFWGAITARPVEIGKRYFYRESMWMKNFESKQLNRTFDAVLFIETFTDKKGEGSQQHPVSKPMDHTATTKMEDFSVKHSGDELSIAELLSNLEKYKNSEVTVKGKVVKISKNIMNRNWIHIQDGTSYEGQYDLTITLNDAPSFELNDIIIFKGTIVLNKDFGAGYFYRVIMEDARVANSAI